MGNVTQIGSAKPKVIEFFAGIGLARMGLEGTGFRVAWSNDFEKDKKSLYQGHFGEDPDHSFVLGDVAEISARDLPRDASLAWASSPCTDLSIAGARAGLAGAQSGTFWHFIRILRELGDDAPPVAVLENVVGLATSHGGEDLAAAIRAFNSLGYSVDVLSIDARRFVPQSRPRLFLVAAKQPPETVESANPEIRPDWLYTVYGDDSLTTHRAQLPTPPVPLVTGLGELMEQLDDSDDRWWSDERLAAFMASLSPLQRDRLAGLLHSPGTKYRTAFRRTRKGVAVWEVRPDDISGCLRTARGGSSKQAVVKIQGSRVQVRWMTPREYSRLMGAGDYLLDGARTSQSLFGFGDAVAVPVVAWLADNYLRPLVRGELAHAVGSQSLSRVQ